MFRYVNRVNNTVVLNVNVMGFFALQAFLHPFYLYFSLYLPYEKWKGCYSPTIH